MIHAAMLLLISSTLAVPALAGQVFPPRNIEDCGLGSVLSWSGSGDVFCRPEASGLGAMTWVSVDLTDTTLFDPNCDYRLKLRDPADHDRVVYFNATIVYPGDGFGRVASDDVNSIVAVTSCLHAWVNSDTKITMRPWGSCSFAPMTEYFGLEKRCPG